MDQADSRIAPSLDEGEPPKRRAFLAGMLGIATAPAVIALPAVAAPEDQELSDLLRLDQELERGMEAYRIASLARADAEIEYYRTAPSLPDELIDVSRRPGCELSRAEVDINGLTASGSRAPARYIYSAKHLQSHIIMWDVSRSSKEGRRLRRLARLAKKYEAAQKVALKESRYDEACCEQSLATTQVGNICCAILDREPTTAGEMMVVARATVAAIAVVDFHSHQRSLAGHLGSKLAETLIRVRDERATRNIAS